MGNVQIRATHPYGFRNGEWAKIQGVVWENNRACYQVVFPDGNADLWPVYDPSDPYGFRQAPDLRGRDFQIDGDGLTRWADVPGGESRNEPS